MSIRETIEWIEVTERLPDEDRVVLVALGESDCGDWNTPTWMGYLDGDEWYSSDGAEIDVISWAELPTGEAAPDALIAAARILLDLARKYASECADCNGTGRVLFTPQSAETYECPDCKDIREIIARATGEASE